MSLVNWNKVKVVLLDFGGVLYPVGYQKTIDEFEKLGVSNFREIFSKEKQASFSDDFEMGKISRETFYNEIRALINVELTDVSFEMAWNAILLGLDLQKLEYAQELRKKVPVYLLSNTNEVHIEQINKEVSELTKHTNLEPYFEGVFLSHELGFRKPNANVFELVSEKMGVKPSEVFFIDDSPQHVSGARNAGMQAYHLELSKEKVEDVFTGLF
jgi:FMN phosphatase YigB (HAD superfamily)